MNWILRLLKLDADSLREVRIEQYRRQMVEAKTREARHYAWKLMQSEINSRSPEQIARMERDQGIA